MTTQTTTPPGWTDARSSVTGTQEPPEGTPAPVLTKPLRTARLVLWAATVDDADATWQFRQLATVNERLTGTPADVDAYRTLFVDPERLATTVIVELRDPDGGTRRGHHRRLHASPRERLGTARSRRPSTRHASRAWMGARPDPDRARIRHRSGTPTSPLLPRGPRRAPRGRQLLLDNDTSWRLMERVGMRRETHAVRESLHRSGRWLDTVAYAVLTDEWPRP
jgi:hypothetical protein